MLLYSKSQAFIRLLKKLDSFTNVKAVSELKINKYIMAIPLQPFIIYFLIK